MNVIEINNISKSYTDFQLKDVSFNVKAGTIMGFVGENGAGKSTTISAILDLIQTDSGNIKLFNIPAHNFPIYKKEDIGVVFDELQFPEILTAEQISKICIKIYKNWDNSIFASYCKRFSLPLGKPVKDFSRGMQMKLNIAVALSHNAKLLIMDEPTSGLDPIVRDDILDVFLDFVQNPNNSIFLSSHITSDLEKIADYITFIHQGKILMTESKDNLIYDYSIIRCGKDDFEQISKQEIISFKKETMQYSVLVKNKKKLQNKYPKLIFDNPKIDEIMLLLVKGNR